MFCSTLTFAPHDAQDCMLKPKSYSKSETGKTQMYAPPMSEFDMLQTKLEAEESEVLKGFTGPGILLVSEGGAQLTANEKQYGLKRGHVFFVSHDVELRIKAGSDGVLLHTAVIDEGGSP